MTGVSRLPTPADLAALQHQFSPSGMSFAATPGAGGFSLAASGSPYGAALSHAPTPGTTFSLASARGGGYDLQGLVLRSPLAYAGTPQPDFGDAGLSPAAASALANAPTPAGGLPAGLQRHYEIRHLSDGTEYMAPASVLRGASSEYGTPLAAQKTPPPGLAELHGDYSIRRISAAAEEEGHRLAAESTPSPHAAGGPLIGAVFSVSRTPTAGSLLDGSEDSFSAAKTPLFHSNPLAM